jgi:Cu2+-exporting ATPase
LLDRSFLTGESEAVEATHDTSLQAGEINLGAPLTLRATAIGEDTTLRRVAALVETAENGRNSYTALADRAAQAYAPVVHLLALFTLLGWWAASGDFRHSLNIAIAVLIITCPCALGLAVPAVSTAAISRLFNAGYLVKHATALERLAEVDHIVFDKTGTLSTPTVTIPAHLTEADQRIALALAQQSNHPLSRALVTALKDVTPAALTDVRETPGQGLEAFVDGIPVVLGRGSWLGAAFTGLGLRIGDATATALPTSETPRGGAQAALAQIEIPAEIVTGDAQRPADAFASQLDLPVLAQATPDDKIARLDWLRHDGKHVLMIGDGLNDTAALASAHAAIAPSTALDASRSAADVVLIKDSFEGLPLILKVARATRRLSQQNFGIATAYNLIAVPLAIAGFATPLAAALSMSISSITVLLNAQRIRRVS